MRKEERRKGGRMMTEEIFKYATLKGDSLFFDKGDAADIENL